MARMRKDSLLLLEAAYRFDLDEASSLRGFLSAARPYDLGSGLLAYVADFAPSPGLRAFAADGAPFGVEAVRGSMRLIPRERLERAHVPGPLVYSGDDAVRQHIGMTTAEFEARCGFRYPRMWLGVGGDPVGPRIVTCLSSDDRSKLKDRDRTTLDAVTAHVGAALRLRSVLCRAPTGDDAPVEAVLSPDGRVLDARTDAAGRARPLLAETVRRFDRARTRKATPEERLELWTALVEGRWSIVESAERDGKRLVLVCRNEPRTRPMRRLSARERSVAQYCALRQPYKYVGYELGISVPAVCSNLRSALRKLGLKSRAELIALFGGELGSD